MSAGATAYTYDNNGNVLSSGARTFSWDLANRVKSTTLTPTTTTYSYDGDGNRLQASTGTTNQSKTNYTWDVNRPLPEMVREASGSDSLYRRHVYGLERLWIETGATSWFFPHRDLMGSTRALTAKAGVVQRTYNYEPFGALRSETGSGVTTPIRFTGQYEDPTGLYFLRARQYEPASGRFLSRDPVAAPLGDSHGSAYGYVMGRPTVFVDPSGMAGERPSSCLGLAPGSRTDSVATAGAGAFAEIIAGINRVGQRGEALLPWDSLRDARVGQEVARWGVPVLGLGLAGYDVCEYRAGGESWPTALLHSGVVNGFGAFGAGAGSSACALFGPTPVAVGCAITLVPVGGYTGRVFGETVWGWLS